MKQTKKLQDILERWGVQLRATDTPVTHQVYEKTKTIEPLPFATYEACIKAVYAVSMSMEPAHYKQFDNAPEKNDIAEWYSHLAQVNGFSLPDMQEPLQDAKLKQANDDYQYCAQLIMDEGLYYDLLD